MDEYRPAESGAMRALFKSLYMQARQQGRGQRFLDAFQTIRAHLAKDPTSFGELTFHLKHMELANYVCVVRPLSVEYCVDEEHKIVYLRRLVLLDEIKSS